MTMKCTGACAPPLDCLLPGMLCWHSNTFTPPLDKFPTMLPVLLPFLTRMSPRAVTLPEARTPCTALKCIPSSGAKRR